MQDIIKKLFHKSICYISPPLLLAVYLAADITTFQMQTWTLPWISTNIFWLSYNLKRQFQANKSAKLMKAQFINTVKRTAANFFL